MGEKPVFTEGLGDSPTIFAIRSIFFGVSWLTSFSILQLASHFLHNFKFVPKHPKSHFNTIELGIFKFTMISSHLLFFTLEGTKSNFSKSHFELPDKC